MPGLVSLTDLSNHLATIPELNFFIFAYIQIKVCAHNLEVRSPTCICDWSNNGSRKVVLTRSNETIGTIFNMK